MVSDMTPDIEATLKSLKVNGFGAHYVRDRTEARELMLKMIPSGASIGVGDSATVRQTAILEELIKRGNNVTNPFTRELTIGILEDPAKSRLFSQTVRRTLGTDVFLTSCNAVTQDGKLVSVDRVGNRVAGTIFGAEKVILPVGRNKIVKDVAQAIDRIKNVLAPAHARRKKYGTPCTVKGECTDCRSPERICNITVILERKPLLTDLSVILINEDLGLGWAPDWDEKRVSAIESAYYENTWSFKRHGQNGE
ncbi:MAG: lactate utilization protein [Dehalococcoidia bacterium]|nr:lactate utilization protein [Dehalococcoidia bacterium]